MGRWEDGGRSPLCGAAALRFKPGSAVRHSSVTSRPHSTFPTSFLVPQFGHQYALRCAAKQGTKSRLAPLCGAAALRVTAGSAVRRSRAPSHGWLRCAAQQGSESLLAPLCGAAGLRVTAGSAVRRTAPPVLLPPPQMPRRSTPSEGGPCDGSDCRSRMITEARPMRRACNGSPADAPGRAGARRRAAVGTGNAADRQAAVAARWRGGRAGGRRRRHRRAVPRSRPPPPPTPPAAALAGGPPRVRATPPTGKRPWRREGARGKGRRRPSPPQCGPCAAARSRCRHPSDAAPQHAVRRRAGRRFGLPLTDAAPVTAPGRQRLPTRCWARLLPPYHTIPQPHGTDEMESMKLWGGVGGKGRGSRDRDEVG